MSAQIPGHDEQKLLLAAVTAKVQLSTTTKHQLIVLSILPASVLLAALPASTFRFTSAGTLCVVLYSFRLVGTASACCNSLTGWHRVNGHTPYFHITLSVRDMATSCMFLRCPAYGWFGWWTSITLHVLRWGGGLWWLSDTLSDPQVQVLQHYQRPCSQTVPSSLRFNHFLTVSMALQLTKFNSVHCTHLLFTELASARCFTQSKSAASPLQVSTDSLLLDELSNKP